MIIINPEADVTFGMGSIAVTAAAHFQAAEEDTLWKLRVTSCQNTMSFILPPRNLGLPILPPVYVLSQNTNMSARPNFIVKTEMHFWH